MVRTCHTARKSTRRQPTGQLAPRDVPPQQEPQPNSPQEEEPFEIVVTVPAGEDSQEAQPMPQNHDQQEEEDNEKEEDGNKLKAKKMMTTLLGATPRRTRYSTMLTKSKLLEMKPRSALAD
jgi:hypothetical protein